MPPHRTRMAIVGLGKIARDQHVPTIAAGNDFELVGVASTHGRLEGVPCCDDLPTLLDRVPGIEAVALCTTPQARGGLARIALDRGLHVLLEKPPCATVSEVLALADLAQQRRLALMASWHSRHAPCIDAACAWLAGRRISTASVCWKEDVRVWHPGQGWIWEAGGLGVFDPGINALSILTRIIPGALALTRAQLHVPRGCQTPVAASLSLITTEAAVVRVDLDFLHMGPPRWDIEVATEEGGRLTLSQGGARMSLNGREVPVAGAGEYAGVYARFAELVRRRSIDVDLRPLQLVADAFLYGTRLDAAALTPQA